MCIYVVMHFKVIFEKYTTTVGEFQMTFYPTHNFLECDNAEKTISRLVEYINFMHFFVI